jgi:hypothetical protein
LKEHNISSMKQCTLITITVYVTHSVEWENYAAIEQNVCVLSITSSSV